MSKTMKLLREEAEVVVAEGVTNKQALFGALHTDGFLRVCDERGCRRLLGR